MSIRLCTCQEALAEYPEDWPDNMHTHDGCRLYHKGKMCQLPGKQEKLRFDECLRGTNSFGDTPDA